MSYLGCVGNTSPDAKTYASNGIIPEMALTKALFLEPKNRIKPKINRTEPEPRAKHNANSSNRTKPKVKFMQPTLYDKSI